MITFRVWFVSNYAHVFVLLSVVIATLPTLTDWRVSDEAVSGRQNPVAIDYDSTADEAERVEQSNVPRRRHRRRRRLRVNTASSVMWLTHKAHSRYATWTKISRLVALILFFAFYLLFVVCMCIRIVCNFHISFAYFFLSFRWRLMSLLFTVLAFSGDFIYYFYISFTVYDVYNKYIRYVVFIYSLIHSCIYLYMEWQRRHSSWNSLVTTAMLEVYYVLAV